MENLVKNKDISIPKNGNVLFILGLALLNHFALAAACPLPIV